MSARQHIRWAAVFLFGSLIAFLSLSQAISSRLDLTADQEFTLADSTIDLLGELDDRLQVKLYFNRDIEGAEGLLPARMVLEDLLEEMSQASDGKMVVEMVDPTTDLAASRDAEHIGIAAVPLPSRRVGSVSMNTLYQGLEMRYQDASEVIPFCIPAEFEFSFVTRLNALLKPEQPRVAFFSRESVMPPPVPGISVPVPADRIFANMRAILRDRYRIDDVTLDATLDGLRLGDDADLLIVARPEGVNENELSAIQHYLAGGGHVLMLWDGEEISPGLGARPIQSGLQDWLASLGVHPQSSLLWDVHSQEAPVGSRDVPMPDGTVKQAQITMPYGFLPVLSDGGLNPNHVVTASLSDALLFWAHPILLEDKARFEYSAETLLSSSEQAWLLPPGANLKMSAENIEQQRAAAVASGLPRSYSLAVSLHDIVEGNGLLTILGDADLFHNASLQAGSINADLLANLVDWMAQRGSLIGLRSRGKRTRRIPHFYNEYIAEQGGAPSTSEEADSLDREAKEYERSERRSLAWSNVFMPLLLTLLLSFAHFSYHAKAAKRPWSRSVPGGEA